MNIKYEDGREDDGVENILKYGIACYKKRCRVMLAENRKINTDQESLFNLKRKGRGSHPAFPLAR